jgi:two-component system chemotaxis response regulator CheB
MTQRDVVVVAASAGGIEALREMLAGVPSGYPGVVLVVLHIPPGGGQALPHILERAGALPASTAVDGESLRGGRIYVCAPDHHLLLGDGRVLVRLGPKENGHRPAADPLFRSAARYYGPRVVGVVLSGTLSDGTAGLQAVRSQGGIAVVQDPDDAMYPGMPTSAIEEVGADHVLSAREIGPLLAALVEDEVEHERHEPSETMRKEVALMEGYEEVVEHDHPGRPSQWPCPDCNGVLWEIADGDVLRFRCRVGHAWSVESLLHQQGTEIEAALWVALRSLEDRLALCEKMADRADRMGSRLSSVRLHTEVSEMRKSVAILRKLFLAQGVEGFREEDERG